MGNASEYKTFNGQVGKRPTNYCSKPPTAVSRTGCDLVPPGRRDLTTSVTLKRTRQSSVENTFTCMQRGEGRQMLELIIQDYQ